MIDLRSDTVTQPSAAMRRAMLEAEVADDVIDVDPTTEALQRRIAELLGKPAALFMPSGTMCNQVAVRLHCRPGDELICEASCHIYKYEQAGYAQLSGVTARTVPGEHGVIRLDQLCDLIRPDEQHEPRTRLIWLENTHNCGGGRIIPFDGVAEICQWARENGLRTHLDGARLFNAVVASGIPAASWSRHFDTVSVCFSKGLGAPVGSALAGSEESIYAMRRHRKLFGGGMRQSGIIAAGALYALEHNIQRLADDHRAAQLIAEAVRESPGLALVPEVVDTNIVFFRIDPRLGTAEDFCRLLWEEGVWTMPFDSRVLRACTHLNVSLQQAQQAAQVIRHVATRIARATAS